MNRTRNSAAAEKLKEFARPVTPQPAFSQQPDSDPPPVLQSQATSEPEPELTLKQLSTQLLAAIQISTTSLTGKIEEVRVDVGLLRHDLQNLRERVKETESRISQLEDAVAPIPDRLSTLEKAASSWSQRADDLENRLRRNNLRILGLPEKTEGADPCSFAEVWLKATFPTATLSSVFAVERAHRVPARPLPPGAPPRPFLVRLLSSRDRDAILQAARQKGDILHNNNVVSIFPDFSAALQKLRASYINVKKRLRGLNITYSMSFPAKLRVIYGDKTVFFTSPNEADSWMNTLRKSPPR